MSTPTHSGAQPSKQLLDSFPAEPPVRALWAPIFIEPIPYSGERWSVGVVVKPKGAHAVVISALQPHALQCLFGRQADEFLAVANLAMDSLRTYTKRTGDLLGWCAPVSGVSLGVLQPGAGDDLIDIARQGLSRSTCLSALLAPSSDEVPEDKDNQDRWPVLVQKSVEQRAPQCASNFRIKIQLREGARKTEFDYVSERAAVGLGNLRPWRLAEDIRVSKSKLADLEQLRHRQGFLPASHYELLVHRPDPNNATFTAAQLRHATEAYLEVEHFADTKNISIEAMRDAAMAGDRILELEGLAA